MKIFPSVVGLLLLISTCNQQSYSSKSQIVGEAPHFTIALEDTFRRMGYVNLVYGTGTEREAKANLAFAQSIKQLSRRFDIQIFPDTAFTEQQFAQNPVYLLGTWEGNQWISQLELPAKRIPEGVLIGDRIIQGKNQSVFLSLLPNPKNPALPLFIGTGTDFKQLAEILTPQKNAYRLRMFGGSLNVSVYDGMKRQLVGQFASVQDTPKLDPQFTWDSSKEPIKVAGSAYFDIELFDVDTVEFPYRKYAARTATIIEQFCDNYFLPRPTSPFSVAIYGNPVFQGITTGKTDAAYADIETETVTKLFGNGFHDWDSGKEIELLMYFLMGDAQSLLMQEGMSLRFTQNWQGKGWKFWAARLAKSQNTLSLADLINPATYEKESPLLRKCMAAAFVEFLESHISTVEMVTYYQNGLPTGNSLAKLTPHWNQYLQDLAAEAPVISRKPVLTQYQQGFNFAHEGYDIYNGYLGDRAVESMATTRDLGANTTSIIPYTWMGGPNEPAWLPFPGFPGMETDESVIRVAHSAKSMGMTVMLKPQVWINNSWPGDVKMTSDQDWETFFDRYYRWMRHYAFLAEIHDMDILCVGVEFVEATLSHPDEWRKIIQKIRGMYAGNIVYAANWGKEFEQLSFWDELDFIGLNCYYPLSNQPNATREELEKGFGKTVKLIKKVADKEQKPILLTEIGFRSIEHPWVSPHADGNGQAVDYDAQQLCYEIMFQQIQDKPFINGLYIWKWPAFPAHWVPGNPSFTPSQKPAQTTVDKFFHQQH